MKIQLRQTLADSHVAAVAISVLLFWSISWAVPAFWGPFLCLFEFLATAVAARDISVSSAKLDAADWVMLMNTCFFFVNAVITFAAAWLLSRWVYGEGPLRSLRRYRGRLARRSHV
jgi:hypothetical protein